MDNSDSRINEEQLSRAGRRRRQNNEEGLIQNNRQILYQQPPVQQQMAASVDQMYHLPHGANPQQQPSRQQAPHNMYQQYMGQQPHPQVQQQRYLPPGANNYGMGGNDFGGQNYAELAQMQQQPPQLPYHNYDNYRGSKTPIVIDNGGWEYRMGWAGEDNPRLVYRYK